jgi:hypothetical protein
MSDDLMKSMIKACVVGFTAAVSLGVATGAVAWTNTDFAAPGIGRPGNPDFTTSGISAFILGSSKSGYTLTVFAVDPRTAKFSVGKQSYSVNDEIFEATAHFGPKGNLLTGLSNTIQIFGAVPGKSGSPIEELFDAKLTAVGVDGSKDALGFATADFSGWATKYAPPDASESLWLYSLNAPGQHASWNQFLKELEDHSGLHDAIFTNLGAITTVPLPASALLLFGGLAGLCGIARLRQRPGISA